MQQDDGLDLAGRPEDGFAVAVAQDTGRVFPCERHGVEFWQERHRRRFRERAGEIVRVGCAREQGSGTTVDKDMLEDLVAAAFNAAVRKAEEVSEEKMGKLMPGGMPGLPPGMKLPF